MRQGLDKELLPQGMPLCPHPPASSGFTVNTTPADARYPRAGAVQEYRIVACGHSLGGGIAALLAMMLRQRAPEVKCYAFAPPGGLLSPAAAAAVKPFVTSVVVGKVRSALLKRQGLRSRS